MLSCGRKIIGSAIAEQVGAKLDVYEWQFGFQWGVLSAATLMEVDAVVKEGRNKIATLGLTKAYDKVN